MLKQAEGFFFFLNSQDQIQFSTAEIPSRKAAKTFGLSMIPDPRSSNGAERSSLDKVQIPQTTGIQCICVNALTSP